MRIKSSCLIAVGCFLFALPVQAQQPALKTFTTDDKSFSFNYPELWRVEVVNADQGPNAHIAIYNLPEEQFDAPDSVLFQVSLPAKSFEIGYANAKTPKEAITQSLGGSGRTTVDFGTASTNTTPEPLQLTPDTPDVKEFSVDGKPAAYAYNSAQMGGVDVSDMVMVVDLGNGYWVSINGSSISGGLKTIQFNEPVILAIVQSMRFTPPSPVYSGNADLPQVFSGIVGIWQRGSIKFFYPKGWYVSNSILLALSNKEGQLLNTQPVSDQFIAAINGVSETRAAADPSELFNQCGTNKGDLTAKQLVEKLLGNLSGAQLEQMKNAGITTTKPETVTVNSVEMVKLRQYQNDTEILNIFVDLGAGNVPSMIVYSKKGEMAQFEKQLLAVASTFQYTPKPCAETSTPSVGTTN